MIPRSIFSGLIDPLAEDSEARRDRIRAKLEQLAILLTDTRAMNERWESNLVRCQKELGALQDVQQPLFEQRAAEAKKALGHYAYRAAILMSELLSDALGTWTPSPDHIGFGLDVHELKTVCEMSGNDASIAGKVMA